MRRAAEEFGVPKSTLYDQLSGKVKPGSSSGPQRYLNEEEEEELSNFLIGCASIGYARSRRQVISLVEDVVRMKGLASKVSFGWWESWRKRHPNISLQTAEPLAHVRSVCSKPEILHNYYDILEEI